MLGKRPNSEDVGLIEVRNDNSEQNNTIVMSPTNGVGFGHFTRMLAIAKRMKQNDPTLEIIFFTTMPTLHLLKPFYGIVKISHFWTKALQKFKFRWME